MNKTVLVTSILLLSSGHVFADRSSAPCSVGCTESIVNLAVSGIPAGPAGTNGTDGTNGTNGQGVPTGGAPGQVLVKLSGTPFDTERDGTYLPMMKCGVSAKMQTD